MASPLPGRSFDPEMRSALIQLLLAVGVSSQKFPNALNASQIDISCFPSKYQVQWKINDPVIVLVSDEWWPAAVTAINYNISTSEDVNSDASDIKPSWFQVRWSSGVPPGTSNEMAVGIDVVQKNDILDCFLLRGLCHSPMATGTSCACGWAEAGVCSKDTVWSPDALFSLLHLACRIDSDHLPSWTSQVTTMLEQQGFSRIFWSANISITAILLFTNFVLICFFIYTKKFARPIRLRRNSGRTATVAVRGSRARRPADRPHTAAREPATPAARAARLERPLGGQGVLGVRRRADSAGGDSASNGDHRRCGAGEVLACPTPRRLLPRLARAWAEQGSK